MADLLATPEDLASALQQNLDASTAALWVEVATAVVQEAAGGQRILQVVDDSFELLGTTDSWLDLPQRPVTDVTDVAIDGEPVSDWVRFGSRLWRRCGWSTDPHEPTTVTGLFTHGYPEGHQGLQLARGAVIGLAQQAYVNPSGGAVAREQIDDYAVAYAAVQQALEASPALAAALRRQYGRRAGIVRIGG
jgi:hypothetical protein